MNEDNDSNKIIKAIKKELYSIKHRSFGKVKYCECSNKTNKLDDLYARKSACTNSYDVESVDKEIPNELKKVRKENFEKKINSIVNVKKKKGNCAAIFQLKEDVVGSKSTPNEATILIDPKTNSEVNSVKEIKRISLQYCQELLTNRKPSEGFEDIIKRKVEDHDKRMRERNPENEYELSLDMFHGALKRVKTKNAKNMRSY